MNINVKKLDKNAVIPTYAKEGDAAMDLTAVSKKVVDEDKFGYIEYGTGLAVEVPEDHVMLLFPRSSVSNTGLILANGVGVVDSGYRGEIGFRYKWKAGTKDYNVGDRVGQLLVLPRPYLKFVEVDELSSSERGTGGYGSTGK
jgi:dUTP pyrophosphatase